MRIFILLFLLFKNDFILAQFAGTQKQLTHEDTLRGSATEERKWWKVLRYDIAIEPFYLEKKIKGFNKITYKVLNRGKTRLMQIDLQAPLIIDSVMFNNYANISFRREGNSWHLRLPKQKIGTHNTVTIYYSGKPHEAIDPPADGGWIWGSDSLGRPWMETFCQGIGASVWFPCKDHQSDEPDNGASVTITAPDTLVAVSNGRLQSKIENNDNTASYKWTVVNPINNYDLCVNIGKYVDVKKQYIGINGILTTDYWVLDYNEEKAQAYLTQNAEMALKCFEYWFGPYPFYEDGFKMVDASYSGEEHQSAIAYGNRYKYGNRRGWDPSGTGWGLKYDLLIVHEIGHEWFGNSITTSDIADKWVHESFAGYAEILYLDYYYGDTAGNEYINARQKHIQNENPIITRYGVNEDGTGSDNFLKGRTIVHMIRQIINNDEKFRQLLLNMNKNFYHKVTTSAAIEKFISKNAEQDFSKLFDQYLRTAQIPILEYAAKGNILQYRFSNCIEGFTMPVKISFNKNRWITPTTRWQEINVDINNSNDSLKVDPNFYLKVKRVGY